MTEFAKVQKGLSEYLDTEVMPAFKEEGWKRVLVGTTIALALRKSEGYLAVIKDNPAIKALGVIDEEGNIDVETLAPILKEQLKEPMTLTVPMLGDLKFGPADVDKLYDYIRTA